MKIKREMALPTCAAFAVLLFCLLILSRCTPNRHAAQPTDTAYTQEAMLREEIARWHTTY